MSGPDISNYSALMELHSAPIDPAWILEGTPVARNRLIAPSTDRFGWTMLWDCTAGKFHWHYAIDETVHVIDGSVTVTSANGSVMTLKAGDIAFFPAGTVAHWHVENYVRKVAYCQKPVPLIVGLPLRLLRKIFAQFGKAVNLIKQSLANPNPDVGTDAAPKPLPQPSANFKAGNVELIGSRSRRA
jgi:uncharacterized cupin superfamily protein